MTPRFMSVKETAEFMSCSQAHVWRMIGNGSIPPGYVRRESPRMTRIDRAAFVAVDPTPIFPAITEDRFRQIVREELARIFRLDRTA